MNNSRAAATARSAGLRGLAVLPVLPLLSLQERQITARATAKQQLLLKTPPNAERGGKMHHFPLFAASSLAPPAGQLTHSW